MRLRVRSGYLVSGDSRTCHEKVVHDLPLDSKANSTFGMLSVSRYRLPLRSL